MPPKYYGIPDIVYRESLLKVAYLIFVDRTHYIEYLVSIVSKNKIDPLSPAILDVIKAPSSSKTVNLPKKSKAEVVYIENSKCTCGSGNDDEDADEGAAFPDRFGNSVCKLHNRISKTG
jgi:hypothetical protein